MDYVLTEHARKRCIRRKIKQEWIAAALAYPVRTENDLEDQSLAHALLAIPEKSFRVLRVVYNETIDPVSVVTAYFDDEVTDL
uniref:DUF4258 domain-containing protein n=1 Tax=Candidatus Kentrum eta TaxID=2126337 RepID=A0A450V4P8_9GAMM|nr:MAG: protein of unknown function (DUF4258) [Candidatus Kentron sp. H]VFJ99739.1 MAG: protein of unknown function (DUF4258) [Candidatus Kentron sp. H]VFK04024.1 MAG: protein of unknown function (DUF4258) [Candidatus Kentron sp. H]